MWQSLISLARVCSAAWSRMRVSPIFDAAGAEVGELAPNDAVVSGSRAPVPGRNCRGSRNRQSSKTQSRTPSPHTAPGTPTAAWAKPPTSAFGAGETLGLFFPLLKARREIPFGVREGEAAQDNALDELPGFGPAFEADHLLRARARWPGCRQAVRPGAAGSRACRRRRRDTTRPARPGTRRRLPRSKDPPARARRPSAC